MTCLKVVVCLTKAVDGEDESNGDWLLRRPRLTQGCSAERMDGCVPYQEILSKDIEIIWHMDTLRCLMQPLCNILHTCVIWTCVRFTVNGQRKHLPNSGIRTFRSKQNTCLTAGEWLGLREREREGGEVSGGLKICQYIDVRKVLPSLNFARTMNGWTVHVGHCEKWI